MAALKVNTTEVKGHVCTSEHPCGGQAAACWPVTHLLTLKYQNSTKCAACNQVSMLPRRVIIQR